jgi:hypothetical protein
VSLSLFIGAINAQESVIDEKKLENVKLEEPAINIIESEYHWINDFHETVSDSVYQSAAWFDDFFSDEGDITKNPKVNARIRLEWRPKSRDWDDVKARFKVKVKLPHFKNKIDLILSDDDSSDQNQLPLETINIRPSDEEEHFSASLRYLHRVDRNKFTDARLGISGGDIFIRGRHRRHIQWDDTHAFKVEPSIYYFVKDGLGSKLLLEYDHQYDDTTQFRVNYSIRGSESFSGIRWKHGFYRLKHLDDTTAAVVSLQAQGERNGARGFVVDNYTLSYRYRFNAYKKWLYFEVEPFLEWPEVDNYSTTPGIALRVEGYFYKGH